MGGSSAGGRWVVAERPLSVRSAPRHGVGASWCRRGLWTRRKVSPRWRISNTLRAAALFPPAYSPFGRVQARPVRRGPRRRHNTTGGKRTINRSSRTGAAEDRRAVPASGAEPPDVNRVAFYRFEPVDDRKAMPSRAPARRRSRPSLRAKAATARAAAVPQRLFDFCARQTSKAHQQARHHTDQGGRLRPAAWRAAELVTSNLALTGPTRHAC